MALANSGYMGKIGYSQYSSPQKNLDLRLRSPLCQEHSCCRVQLQGGKVWWGHSQETPSCWRVCPATMPGSTSAPPTTGWAPSPLLISPSQSYVSTIFTWGGRVPPPCWGVPVLRPQWGGLPRHC
jgi:hypothetical protein